MSPARSEAPPLTEEQLRRLGKRRDAAQRRLEAVDEEVRAAIVASAGVVPKLRIAQALGVARQTVYDVLERAKA